jgi:uroporphyrin-III C-methyltransferase/precorrin-2 dehydrogenase/sirohydrochlorin ferrochelatase
VSDADAAAVSAAAHAAHALVFASDRPALSDLAMPAVVRRGPVTVAVSTSGTSPVLARRLREELDRLLPAELGPLAERLGELRETLMAAPREERIARLEEALRGLAIEGRLVLPATRKGSA